MRLPSVGPLWRAASLAVALGVLAPVLALVWLALGSDLSHWGTCCRTCCRRRPLNTAVLLAGVGALVLVIGTGCAWLVSDQRLSGSGRAAVGPAAAAGHADLHRGLRLPRPAASASARCKARFAGCSASTAPGSFDCPTCARCRARSSCSACVLYPYVYLSARAMFMTQPAHLMEAARTLGAGRARRLLSRGAAAGPAGAGRRAEPGAARNPQRHRRFRIPRHPDAHGGGLHHLDHALRPGRRSTDRLHDAGLRAAAAVAGAARAQAPAIRQRAAHAADAAAPLAGRGRLGRNGGGQPAGAARLRRAGALPAVGNAAPAARWQRAFNELHDQPGQHASRWRRA